MPAPDFASVLARFRPIFARIAEGAAERERRRILPSEQLGWLAEAGFGAVRVPVAHGGAGVTIPQLATLLVELAAADSNLTQILRGHVAFVEDRLVAEPGEQRDDWLRRFVAGEIVGNAWSEIGSGALGTSQTRLERRDGRWVLNGRKFYTTGSIFAQWIDTTARREDGAEVTALVRRDAPGVTVVDDWDGFGQSLTGTGTAVFEDAPVEEQAVLLFSDRFRYQTALYQLVLLSVLAGIARAATEQTAALVRARTRVFSHGSADLVRNDPQIQAVVGGLSAAAYVAEATVARVAEAVQAAHDTAGRRDSDEDVAANIAAEIASAEAQVVLTRLVTTAATDAFDALSASAISSSVGLDRHWRNARAVSSHNPVVYKAKMVGDWVVNGTTPVFAWSIGTAPSTLADPEPADLGPADLGPADPGSAGEPQG